MKRSYWGPLADEPWWLKAVALAVKPGIPIAMIVMAGYFIWFGWP